MKKALAAVLIAAALGLAGTSSAAEAAPKAKIYHKTVQAGNKTVTVKGVKGKLVEWVDTHNFKVKLDNGQVFSFKTPKSSYSRTLKRGNTYNYFFVTNKSGQNNIVKVTGK
ncbi:hypothetical protein [Cytobacillus oceanisediminis]|uniref:hypothetical protein n=1 Tax=Cytobacillus oceanisediminis TaxID=665099 RepID=UPI001FB3D395|nr:hypothetical protein [Cytobacillus oceanisediminis]UOE58145.1 hypothetical protein IRB79_26940 [Cytobacillus oceanisediminis]